MKDIKPGIYRGVSFEEYASWPLVHHSDLVLMNKTPAHVKEFMESPKPSTPTLDFGRAYHSIILEPEKFKEEFATAPRLQSDGRKLDKRTTVGKETWAEFEAEHGHKTILSAEDWDRLQAMRVRLMSHLTAKELISSGDSEVSIVWVDPETEIKCKARIDRMGEKPFSFLMDLKTTGEDASERSFQNTMGRYKYHQQAGMYSEGLNQLMPGDRRFIFMVQEKDRPHLVGCYEIDPVALSQGRKQFRRNLQRLKECAQSGIWEGYGEGLGLVSLPQWALDMDDFVSVSI